MYFEERTLPWWFRTIILVILIAISLFLPLSSYGINALGIITFYIAILALNLSFGSENDNSLIISLASLVTLTLVGYFTSKNASSYGPSAHAIALSCDLLVILSLVYYIFKNTLIENGNISSLVYDLSFFGIIIISYLLTYFIPSIPPLMIKGVPIVLGFWALALIRIFILSGVAFSSSSSDEQPPIDIVYNAISYALEGTDLVFNGIKGSTYFTIYLSTTANEHILQADYDKKRFESRLRDYIKSSGYSMKYISIRYNY